MSKYDSIETATELVAEVKANGLSTATEDICRVQDIFGNAPVEELVQLANDVGQAGSRDTQSVFYVIITNIWNWADVMHFWNQHTNPEHKQVEELREKLKAEMAEHSNTKKALEEQRVSTDAEHKFLLAERGKRIDQWEKIESLKADIHDRDMTIMELKAKQIGRAHV